MRDTHIPQEYPMEETPVTPESLAEQHSVIEDRREGAADTSHFPGVLAALGEMKPGTIVSEEGLAQLFKRHVVSVKRAVERAELPPPCRLFGTNVWTAGALLRYIEKQLDKAAQDAEREAQRKRNLSPMRRQ
jgi:hypothetical protein